MKILKLFLAVILAAVIVFAARQLFALKTETMGEAYSDIIFTRLAVEAQTYTRQLEYGLRNGKTLENFYGVNNILSEVKRCYSYTTGVYIVSNEYQLLYSAADADEPALRYIRSMAGIEEGTAYVVYDDIANSRYLLSVPIVGREGDTAGYMVINVSYDAVENTMHDRYPENVIQTIATAALVYLIGVLALIHRCRKAKNFCTCVGRVMSVTTAGYILLDGGLSIYKLMVSFESIIQQSVSKILLVLQHDLDTVGEKGVAFNKIYDLNTFLLETAEQVPYVNALIYDKNYHITAEISEKYIWQQTAGYAVRLGTALLVCAAAGIVLVLLCVGIDLLKNALIARRTKKNGRQQTTTATDIGA